MKSTDLVRGALVRTISLNEPGMLASPEDLARRAEDTLGRVVQWHSVSEDYSAVVVWVRHHKDEGPVPYYNYELDLIGLPPT